MFLLDPVLTVFAISDQRVRNIFESALDGLLVRKEHLFVLGFGVPDICLEPSSPEYRLADRSDQRP